MIIFYEAEKPGVPPLRVFRAGTGVATAAGAPDPASDGRSNGSVLRHGEWVASALPRDVLQSREVGDNFAVVMRWAVLPNGHVISLIAFQWDDKTHFWLHSQETGVARYSLSAAAHKAYIEALPPDVIHAPAGAPLNEQEVRRLLARRVVETADAEAVLAREHAARAEQQRGAKLARLRELSERMLESLTAAEYAERMKLKRELRGQL